MPGRDLESDPASSPKPPQPVVVRAPANWTAVAFFGALSLLHLAIAGTALFAHRWEAHMSVVFGGLFALVAVGCVMLRHEVAVLPDVRRIALRTALGRLAYQRSIPFSAVNSVRVLLLGAIDRGESSVTIVCENEDVELPPTPTPRQHALLLAMLMNVRLVKIYGDTTTPEPAQRIAKLLSSNEDAN